MYPVWAIADVNDLPEVEVVLRKIVIAAVLPMKG